MEYEKLVRKYIEECRARGVGECTLQSRESYLLRFGVWLRTSSNRPPLNEVTGETIMTFLKMDSTFKAKATIAGRMSHLRCFGDFLNREGVWRRNYVRWLRGPRLLFGTHKTKALSREEIEKVIEAAFAAKAGILRHLWPVMIMCFFTLGLRRGELLRLNLLDWSPKEKTLRISSTKSNWDRYLPVPTSLTHVLEAYVLARHRLLAGKNRLDEPALFVNIKGERVSENSCSVGIQKIAERAGVEKFHVHRLRHTCATELVANGVSLPVVKKVLGHACYMTTARYVQVSGPERKRAVELHPINQMLGA